MTPLQVSHDPSISVIWRKMYNYYGSYFYLQQDKSKHVCKYLHQVGCWYKKKTSLKILTHNTPPSQGMWNYAHTCNADLLSNISSKTKVFSHSPHWYAGAPLCFVNNPTRGSWHPSRSNKLRTKVAFLPCPILFLLEIKHV